MNAGSKNPSSLQHHKDFLQELVKILQSKDDKFTVSKLNGGERAKFKGVVSGLSAGNGNEEDGFLERMILAGEKEAANKSRIINWKIVNHGKQTIIIL